MNKAFVREPEADDRGYCPRCGTLGVRVSHGPLDTHIQPEHRAQIADSAWYCPYARCDVAYFDAFERCIAVKELVGPVYPYELDAPICACFGLTYDDVEADAHSDVPIRIRGLLEKSKSDAARCGSLAVDGQCCIREVQQLFMKLRARPSSD
jgi:Zinc binding domain